MTQGGSLPKDGASDLDKPASLRDNKAMHELAYWKGRLQAEGTLSNAHYQHFYTTHFGLLQDDYRNKRVLDIGCGPRGSLEWADMALERVGLDPLAREYRQFGTARHKMHYVVGTSECVPFRDGWFDVVSSFNSLDHIDDLGKTLQELARVTKKTGLLLLLTDVNHRATPCEPTVFSWDVVMQFRACFALIEQRHYEKQEKGLYQSVLQGLPYDHNDATPRYGILSAKFRKR